MFLEAIKDMPARRAGRTSGTPGGRHSYSVQKNTSTRTKENTMYGLRASRDSSLPSPKEVLDGGFEVGEAANASEHGNGV